MPFITAGGTDDATLGQLRRALTAAIDAAPDACRSLGLVGIATDGAAYGRIRARLEHGLRHGCARLTTLMNDLI